VDKYFLAKEKKMVYSIWKTVVFISAMIEMIFFAQFFFRNGRQFE